ncbi:MAG: hypothetical protein LC723_06985 [Actinobacteria bacterium]|nr:hypothetical protein [Actinomycetota bacterium]
MAIAVIQTQGLDESWLARERQEAQAMAKLGDHPIIVALHDIANEGLEPYLVSQYMAGRRGTPSETQEHRIS